MIGPRAVYRIDDAAGVLLYVGSSADPLERLWAHAGRPWATFGQRVRVDWHHDETDAWAAERQAHQDEAPVFYAPGTSGATSRRERERRAPRAAEYVEEATRPYLERWEAMCGPIPMPPVRPARRLWRVVEGGRGALASPFGCRYVSVGDAAALAGAGRDTLLRWQREGHIPPMVRAGVDMLGGRVDVLTTWAALGREVPAAVLAGCGGCQSTTEPASLVG